MSFEYSVEIFKSNGGVTSPHDVLYDIRCSLDSLGIVHTHFRTKEKYYDVREGGTLFEDDKRYQLIEISPFVFDEEYNEIGQHEVDRYHNHPDWFILVIGIRCPVFDEDSFISVITPEKYEYHVAHIPIAYALGHDLEYEEHQLVF